MSYIVGNGQAYVFEGRLVRHTQASKCRGVACSGKLISALCMSLVISTEYVSRLSRWQGLMGSLEMQYPVYTCNCVPGGAVQFILFKVLNSLSVKRLEVANGRRRWRRRKGADWSEVHIVLRWQATRCKFSLFWLAMRPVDCQAFFCSFRYMNIMRKSISRSLKISVLFDSRESQTLGDAVRIILVLCEIIVSGFAMILCRVMYSAKRKCRSSKAFHL